jgi:hypothetical protein
MVTDIGSRIIHETSCEKKSRKNFSKYFKNDVECGKVFGVTLFYGTVYSKFQNKGTYGRHESNFFKV